MKNHLYRRSFLAASGACLATAPLAVTELKAVQPPPPPPRKPSKLVLGMASYTFRSFKLEEAVAMTKRLGLTRISLKDMHLPMNSSDADIQAATTLVKNAGIEPYSCGVVYMRSEQEVNRAFEYAKAARMSIIIGVPNHELLDLVQKKVQEYNIRVAVHNHGPSDKLYPSPESIMDKIKNLDKRIGLCVDIGHTQRIAIDPSETVMKYADRLLDVHIKDVSASNAQGSTVEIGRGVIAIPKFLKTLIQLNYTGVVSLEYEKDAQDPLPGAAESIGYLNGVLAAL
jgi:inosose dehydratase